MSTEIQAYIDQIINTPASKEDMTLLKLFRNAQNQLIKSFEFKVFKSEEKVEENNFTTKNLEKKVKMIEAKSRRF